MPDIPINEYTKCDKRQEQQIYCILPHHTNYPPFVQDRASTLHTAWKFENIYRATKKPKNNIKMGSIQPFAARHMNDCYGP